jgi:hypothetical protein
MTAGIGSRYETACNLHGIEQEDSSPLPLAGEVEREAFGWGIFTDIAPIPILPRKREREFALV